MGTQRRLQVIYRNTSLGSTRQPRVRRADLINIRTTTSSITTPTHLHLRAETSVFFCLPGSSRRKTRAGRAPAEAHRCTSAIETIGRAHLPSNRHETPTELALRRGRTRSSGSGLGLPGGHVGSTRPLTSERLGRSSDPDKRSHLQRALWLRLWCHVRLSIRFPPNAQAMDFDGCASGCQGGLVNRHFACPYMRMGGKPLPEREVGGFLLEYILLSIRHECPSQELSWLMR